MTDTPTPSPTCEESGASCPSEFHCMYAGKCQRRGTSDNQKPTDAGSDSFGPSPEAVEAVAQAIYRELVDKVGLYSIPDVAEAAARAALRAIDVAPLVEALQQTEWLPIRALINSTSLPMDMQGARERWLRQIDRLTALATFDSQQGGKA